MNRRTATEPREIRQPDAAHLVITWADGVISDYAAPDLRRLCPCAQCVNEFTGERVLRPESVRDDLTIRDFDVTGRYALNFRWSDHHDTGIYSFKLLRQIADEATGSVAPTA